MSRIEQERDRFYAWWRDQPMHQRFDDPGTWDDGGMWRYDEPAPQYAWGIWQAAVGIVRP